MIGNGIGAGANAFLASASMTVESLPPENSRHGRRISATTSRKMKMLSASRASRWPRTWVVTGTRRYHRRLAAVRPTDQLSPPTSRPDHPEDRHESRRERNGRLPDGALRRGEVHDRRGA